MRWLGLALLLLLVQPLYDNGDMRFGYDSRGNYWNELRYGNTWLGFDNRGRFWSEFDYGGTRSGFDNRGSQWIEQRLRQ